MNKTWTAILLALATMAVGLPSYLVLNELAVMPAWLRDHPWPLEVASIALTFILGTLTGSAFREGKRRAITAASFIVSLAATASLIFALHVAVYELPPPPQGLNVGTTAADFELPDDTGKPFALSSLRGKKVVLFFYRGFW